MTPALNSYTAAFRLQRSLSLHAARQWWQRSSMQQLLKPSLVTTWHPAAYDPTAASSHPLASCIRSGGSGRSTSRSRPNDLQAATDDQRVPSFRRTQHPNSIISRASSDSKDSSSRGGRSSSTGDAARMGNQLQSSLPHATQPGAQTSASKTDDVSSSMAKRAERTSRKSSNRRSQQKSQNINSSGSSNIGSGSNVSTSSKVNTDSKTRGSKQGEAQRHTHRKVFQQAGWHQQLKSTPTSKQKQQRQGGGKGALDCQHYDLCSGCNMCESLTWPQQYEEARQFFFSLGLSEVGMVAGPLSSWRRRAKLAVRGRPGAPLIGLFRERSHEVEPIPYCTAHHPRINQAAALVQQVATGLCTPPFNEEDGSGLLRYLQLTVVTPSLQGIGGAPPDPTQPIPTPDKLYNQPTADVTHLVQVVLVVKAEGVHSPEYPAAARLADAVWAQGGPHAAQPLVHSVWLNFQPATGTDSNAVLGRSWHLAHGPRHVWEAWGGVPVCIAPGSFVQANYGAFSSAITAMRAALPAGARHMVEMHAGVGAIGLSLSAGRAAEGQQNQLQSLRCVEINPEAEAPFLQSRQALITRSPPDAPGCNNSAGVGPASAPNIQGKTSPSTCSSAHDDAALPVLGSAGVSVGSLTSGSAGVRSAAAAPHMEYVVGAAGDAAESLLSGADVVVVDPPRKGLEPSLLTALVDISWEQQPHDEDQQPPQADLSVDGAHDQQVPAHKQGHSRHHRPLRRLLYLSCGWAALKRDAAALLGLAPVTTHAPATPTPGSMGLAPVTIPSPATPIPSSMQQGRHALQADSGSEGMVHTPSAVHSDMWVRVRPARWRLVSATAFLFFPGTNSIETLAIFEELPSVSDTP